MGGVLRVWAEATMVKRAKRERVEGYMEAYRVKRET
jgi:hypothetical protein